MSQTKIKTKEHALNLLNQLSLQLNETMYFLNRQEILFFQFAQKQLQLMQNSINHSDDFFSQYFKNKNQDEITEWIEKEAQKW